MINKIFHSSRAYPLGSVYSWHQVESVSGFPMLIFVNIKPDFWDVLVFLEQNLYFCRYQFPRYSWYVEDIVEYLQVNLNPNGTIQKSERTHDAPTQNT